MEVCRIAVGACDGKVTRLTLRYTGSASVRLQVIEGKARQGSFNPTDRDPLIFDATIAPGQTFTLVGTDKQGTLGPEISLFVNGALSTNIHTSCSQPIGPGLVRGSFVVVAGESRNGGALPPVAPNAQQ